MFRFSSTINFWVQSLIKLISFIHNVTLLIDKCDQFQCMTIFHTQVDHVLTRIRTFGVSVVILVFHTSLIAQFHQNTETFSDIHLFRASLKARFSTEWARISLDSPDFVHAFAVYHLLHLLCASFNARFCQFKKYYFVIARRGIPE